MGLSVSQVRLLTITNRANNVNSLSQKLDVSKQELNKAQAAQNTKKSEYKNTNDSATISNEAVKQFLDEKEPQKYDKSTGVENKKMNFDEEKPEKTEYKSVGKPSEKEIFSKHKTLNSDETEYNETKNKNLKLTLSKLAVRKSY